jgi:cytochrome c553
MEVSKINTETMVKNMRSEGLESRADYLELMQKRIVELEAESDGYFKETIALNERIAELEQELARTKSAIGSCAFCHGSYVHVAEVK